MKLDNISAGLIIKNYKEFCELVDEEIKGGKSKQYQIKEWERYLTFKRDGNRYIITEIFDTPVEKSMNGNNSIYGDYMKNLIMDLLVCNLESANRRTLHFTANDLLRLLKMVNINYLNGKKNIPDFSKILEIDEDHIYEFFETTDTNLKSSLETALNQLQRENKIMWNKIVMVYVEEEDIKTHRIITHYREATDEECEIIMECKEEVLRSLGYAANDLPLIILKRQWESFVLRLNNLLYEKRKILFSYKTFKLIINRKKIEREYNKTIDYWRMTDFNRVVNQRILNDLITTRYTSNLIKRHQTALESIDNYYMKKFRMANNYVDTQEKLINTFINRDAHEIQIKNNKVDTQLPLIEEPSLDPVGCQQVVK